MESTFVAKFDFLAKDGPSFAKKSNLATKVDSILAPKNFNEAIIKPSWRTPMNRFFNKTKFVYHADPNCQ